MTVPKRPAAIATNVVATTGAFCLPVCSVCGIGLGDRYGFSSRFSIARTWSANGTGKPSAARLICRRRTLRLVGVACSGLPQLHKEGANVLPVMVYEDPLVELIQKRW